MLQKHYYVTHKPIIALPPFKSIQSCFSQSLKDRNIGIIANFVFPCFYSLHIDQDFMMLVNMKIYISGCERIVYQGCILHWYSYFLMAQLKQNWQYCHSCAVAHLWKTLLNLQTCGTSNSTLVIHPEPYSDRSANFVLNDRRKTLTELTHQLLPNLGFLTL